MKFVMFNVFMAGYCVAIAVVRLEDASLAALLTACATLNVVAARVLYNIEVRRNGAL